VPVVLGVMYTASLAAMAAYVAATGTPAPSGRAAGYALAAGLCGIAGLGAFYRGLAIGTMSIVAPISATGVALPVIVGLLQGDRPGPVGSAGLVLAVVGVVLASRETRPDDAPPLREDARRQSVLLALFAGLAFGAYFAFADLASEESVAWALLLSRVISTPVLLAIVVVSVGVAAIPRSPVTLAQLAVIGMLDLIANACYNVATTKGDLSSVAVAAALYPVVTVLLAAAFLRERVRGSQSVGVVAALTGVVLIAAG
jgi:drug/metabolite transporter (DMT)-like permease